jgi:hypothetical protein
VEQLNAYTLSRFISQVPSEPYMCSQFANFSRKYRLSHTCAPNLRIFLPYTDCGVSRVGGGEILLPLQTEQLSPLQTSPHVTMPIILTTTLGIRIESQSTRRSAHILQKPPQNFDIKHELPKINKRNGEKRRTTYSEGERLRKSKGIRT